ncbi:MAG: 4'-phosphopantetheinyl transferase superfamily protein [Wenzhouxiangella sp.]|nr:4'-phosphopantetheinyl transferase superfamily protein [Wenzhouxiangella sp.]TVR95893.1 MAG: 4'-phosphopantetheinyl transferase superfamily protein [Wenzhouxiangellaceae bacterium]
MGWISVHLPLRRRPLPPAHSVDLWLTDLDELPLEAGPGGLARRERVLRRRIQQQFLLRLLLGAYLGIPGKEVSILRPGRGKPELVPEQAASGLRFNLSHSGGWLAVAVSRGLEVGVDVERDRPLSRPDELARRYFSKREAEWLNGLEPDQRMAAFLKQWTAREALVKAMGTGLAGALSEIELAWQPPRIRRLPGGWPEPGAWSLLSPDMPAGLYCRLAVPAPGVALRCHFLQACA